MSVTLPDDVPAEVGELGEPLAEFTTGGLVFAAYVGGGIVCVLLGLAALGFGVAVLAHGPKREVAGVFKLMAFGLFLAATGAGVLARSRSIRGLRVFACRDGLARVQGPRAELLRWEDVNAVRHDLTKRENVTVRSPYRVILVRRDGKEVEFNEALSDVKRLRELAEERTLPFMLPAALEAVRAGETVGFGEVSVSPEGIHAGKDTLPWEDFADAEAKEGRLLVRAAGRKRPFFKIDIAKVSNPHVFLAVAEQARYEGA
jgi:uncharacterized protein DUF6585